MSTPRKITYMSVYSLERYTTLVAAGLCVRCKGQGVPGQRMCDPCRELVRDRQRERYRRARGIPSDAPRWSRGRELPQPQPACGTGG